jgi:hypothetical protein
MHRVLDAKDFWFAPELCDHVTSILQVAVLARYLINVKFPGRIVRVLLISPSCRCLR